MKKHSKHLLFLIFLSIIFLTPILLVGFFETHDGEAHVARFAAYYKAFSDFQIPPRWAADLNFSYGSPVFIFYYPLPGYLASFFHLFGFSFEAVFKMLLVLSFLFAPVVFYFWAVRRFSKGIALAGAMLYGFAPYHFLNTFVRGDIAEQIAFIFIPLVFFLLDRMRETGKKVFILLCGVAFALLILSHNGISLMFALVLLCYGFFLATSKRQALEVLSAFFYGALLSAFFWLPALVESRYVKAHILLQSLYQEHFAPLWKLAFSPWGFGPDINIAGGLSPQLGVIVVLLVIGSLVSIIPLRQERRRIGFWLLVFFTGCFLATSYSQEVWSNLVLLRYFEFPWRFIALASFAGSVLGMYALYAIKTKSAPIVVILCVIVYSIQFLKIIPQAQREDAYYEQYKATTYYHGEASSIWTAGDPYEVPKEPIVIIEGNGFVKNYVRIPLKHSFTTKSSGKMRLLDNTSYFPGWQVLIDGKKEQIEFQDIQHRGLITFFVEKGEHRIDVRFRESPIRLFANVISIVAMVFTSVFFIIYYAKERRKIGQKVRRK